MERIDLVVGFHDLLGGIGIQIQQSVKRLVKHLNRAIRHGGKMFGQANVGLPRQKIGGLRDIYGQISDAFEVVIDLENGDQKAQVDGDRLVQRQNLQAFFFKIDFQGIDLRIGVDDLLC